MFQCLVAIKEKSNFSVSMLCLIVDRFCCVNLLLFISLINRLEFIFSYTINNSNIPEYSLLILSNKENYANIEANCVVFLKIRTELESTDVFKRLTSNLPQEADPDL